MRSNRYWGLFAALTVAAAINLLVGPSRLAAQESKSAQQESPKQEPLSVQQREELERRRAEIETKQKVIGKKIDETAGNGNFEHYDDWCRELISLLRQELEIVNQLFPEGSDVAKRSELLKLHLVIAAEYELYDYPKVKEQAQLGLKLCEELYPPAERHAEGDAFKADL